MSKKNRITNYKAMGLINAWLLEHRLPPIHGGSYVQNANMLQSILSTAGRIVPQKPFLARPEAAYFLHHFAKSITGRLPLAPRVPKEKPVAEQRLRDFYTSWEWKRARYDFLKDKKRRCQCCGSAPENGARIVVDHVKPIRHFWHLRVDPANLQILCDDCNMGKGSRDHTDWR